MKSWNIRDSISPAAYPPFKMKKASMDKKRGPNVVNQNYMDIKQSTSDLRDMGRNPINMRRGS